MAIQIGKYKRPGIFIEEFDDSPISSPTVNGISSLVIGISKKGPINTPILIQNTTDLEKIFGPLDRNLERKGSFFHRTVSKMLESSPVYAMNLLSTSDILDKIEYKSLSTSTDKSNDVTREGAYRKFFDTTGFWKRDTDSFINLTKNDLGQSDRLISFTNMSDKYITTFVFKSKIKGFDRTLIEWYGSSDKVPSFVNELDYASDYMVDVLVVAGDWSNYQQLSVDSKWSAYFTSTGLSKDQVSNFANDRNVNLLSYYEGVSLIPYFRDSNGRNIFIETIVNQDTDKTGLFCAFDSDKFESDYPNGMIDLIGNNLVSDSSLTNSGQTTIDFLSYNTTITESLSFNSTPLDIAGGNDGQNIVALGASLSLVRDIWGGNNRTAFYSESYINGLSYATGSTILTGTNSIQIGFTLSDANLGASPSGEAYVVIGGEKITINSGTTGSQTFSIPASSYTVSTMTASYTSVIYIDSENGNINVKNGTVNNVNPTLNNVNDVVLGYVQLNVQNGTIIQATGSRPTWNSITATHSGYNELLESTDYTVTDLGSGSIKVEFLNTASVDVTSNYEQNRKIKLFNFLVNMLDSPNISEMVMIKDFVTKEKMSLENATITNIVTTNTSNKSFVLNLGTTTTPTDIANGNLVFYKIDNEFVLGTDGVNTRMTLGTASTGIIAKNSTMYNSFFNGLINSGDFFYRNITDRTSRVVLQNSGGDGYIVFDSSPWATTTWGFNLADLQPLLLPESTLNTGSLVIESVSDVHTTLADPATGLTYSGTYIAYKLTKQVTSEDIPSVTKVYDASTKVYLQMYLDSSNNLKAKFVDSDLSATIEIDSSIDSNIKVISDKSNFKQTIEIEEPAGYTPVPNKILVLGSRFTEVKIGDFLQAYVDTSNIVSGSVPRRLTRIISKKAYAADPTLSEITCDSAINKFEFLGDYQTMRYNTIDSYVSTYKAIPLKGFRVREASMSDGTETRQNAILNLVSKGTPLFKALTNKEAIDFRYVVDSFGLGLTERSKQQLVDICGDRLDCLGFLNMPSIKSFKNSTSPSFVDSEGVLQTSFIASGGDLESNPSFLYSFGDGRGSSCVGYFLPYVQVNDNGRPMDVPPAMYVATTYMRKQTTNVTSITPWTIAAGVTNGKVTNIAGLEMDFTPSDIEFLNGAQINPIVYKKNRGFIIETENTGQTLYKSALSFLHVREVLIELERELSAMLLDFQWKFNTAEIRAEIKLRADVICEKFVNKNGLYNYFNKCDEENNTSTVIDNQIGVLDTYVEPIKGMGIIVNNVTILRTGAIASGGFINQ